VHHELSLLKVLAPRGPPLPDPAFPSEAPSSISIVSTMNKILVLAFLFSSATCLATGHGKCVELTLPVTVTAENLVWAFPPLKNGYEATYFFNLLTQRDGNGSALVAGKANITETFSISAQFCTPNKKSHKSKTVQVLTHGLGFEKRLVILT
jgi:hypothetical protein